MLNCQITLDTVATLRSLCADTNPELYEKHENCIVFSSCTHGRGSAVDVRRHHVLIHRQPIHVSERQLHHERPRNGNVDVDDPPRSKHVADGRDANLFYIYRWSRDTRKWLFRPFS